MSVQGNQVAIGIDNSPLVRGLSETFDRVQGSMDHMAGRIDSGMSRIAQGVAAAVTAIATKGAAQAIAAVGDIGDISEKVGIASSTFQELSFAVTVAGGSVKETASALKFFSLRMSEVKSGQGEFFQFLKKTAPELITQLRATQDTEGALRVMADTLARLGSEYDKNLVMTKAFGGASDNLMKVLKDGGNAFDKAREEAAKYGVVIGADMIAQADKADESLNRLSSVIGTTLKRELAELAPVIESVANWLAKLDLASRVKLSLGLDLSDTTAIERRLVALREELGKVKESSQITGFWSWLTDSSAGAFQVVARITGEIEKLEEMKRSKVPLELKGTFDGTAVEREVLTLKKQVESKPWKTTIVIDHVDKLDKLRERAEKASGDVLSAIRTAYERELSTFQKMLAEKKITEAEYLEARDQLNQVAAKKISDLSLIHI